MSYKDPARCIHCNKARDIPGTLCDSCRTRNLAAQKRRYAKLRAAGLCVQCRKASAAPGHHRCPECLQASRARRRQDYRSYKAQGICVTCRNAKAMAGRTQCASCAEARQRARAAARRDM